MDANTTISKETDILAKRIAYKAHQHQYNSNSELPNAKPTAKSMVDNMFKIINEAGGNGITLPEELVTPKTSGLTPPSSSKPTRKQKKYKNNKNYTTEFTDGTSKPGVHGIEIHATEFSSYSGSKCALCGQIHDLKLCAKCQLVYYCGKACQLTDWGVHKKECKKKLDT